MSNEVAILPEMLEAGMLVLKECRKEGKTDYDTAIAVYLAMRAIEAVITLRRDGETLH